MEFHRKSTRVQSNQLSFFEGTEAIGERALEGLCELERVRIPSNVSAIAPNPLTGCPKLVQFDASRDNEEYSTKG